MTEEPKIYKSIQEALLVYSKESKKNYNESMSAPVTIPDWKESTAEELNGISLEQLIRDELLEEIKKEHDKQLNAVLIHPEVYKYLTRKSHKKIKRRLFYDVYYWSNEGYRVSKYFESSKKARNYVNHIYTSGLMKDVDYVRMEKTFCYRNHSPRHKWFYISEKPDTFICVEKY
jgi:hypothetical protein